MHISYLIQPLKNVPWGHLNFILDLEIINKNNQLLNASLCKAL